MLALVFTSFAWMIPVRVSANDENSVLIPESDIPLRLWYDEAAPSQIRKTLPMLTEEAELMKAGSIGLSR